MISVLKLIKQHEEQCVVSVLSECVVILMVGCECLGWVSGDNGLRKGWVVVVLAYNRLGHN